MLSLSKTGSAFTLQMFAKSKIPYLPDVETYAHLASLSTAKETSG